MEQKLEQAMDAAASVGLDEVHFAALAIAMVDQAMAKPHVSREIAAILLRENLISATTAAEWGVL